MDNQIYDWLSDVYLLVDSGKTADAIDAVFDCFDDMFEAQRFQESDNVLAAVDITRLDTNLMVAFLTITRCEKDKLLSRSKLVQSIENHLEKSQPDRVEELMHGLR